MLDPDECKILGLPVRTKVRYSDDPDVIEEALLMRIEGRRDDSKGVLPDQAIAALDRRNRLQKAYEKDLQIIEARLSSRATQNKD